MNATIEIPKRIRSYGPKVEWLVQNSLYDYSNKAAFYIRDRYLNGKALAKITGETYQHFGATYSKRKRTYLIRPGLEIDGNQNYLAHWAHAENLKWGHNFVIQGYKEYQASRDISKEIAQRIEKEA